MRTLRVIFNPKREHLDVVALGRPERYAKHSAIKGVKAMRYELYS